MRPPALVLKRVKVWRRTPVRLEAADGVAVPERKPGAVVLGVKHLHVFRHCIL